MWTAFLLGLGAGIAATPHCLGMCGGFPLHLAKPSRQEMAGLRRGTPASPQARWKLQVLFVIGKSFTYVFLGALAGALGVILLKDTSLARGAPLIRLAAGGLMILFGLLMLGFRLPPVKVLQGLADNVIVHSLFRGLLMNPGPAAAFVLGLGVGFLPCPLPMGMLAAAAASHSVPHGMALMAGVGLGTAPGLLAVGLFGVGLSRRFTRVGMRAAGGVVLALGLLTIGRVTASVIHAKAAPTYTIPSCCNGEVQP